VRAQQDSVPSWLSISRRKREYLHPRVSFKMKNKVKLNPMKLDLNSANTAIPAKIPANSVT